MVYSTKQALTFMYAVTTRARTKPRTPATGRGRPSSLRLRPLTRGATTSWRVPVRALRRLVAAILRRLFRWRGCSAWVRWLLACMLLWRWGLVLVFWCFSGVWWFTVWIRLVLLCSYLLFFYCWILLKEVEGVYSPFDVFCVTLVDLFGHNWRHLSSSLSI